MLGTHNFLLKLHTWHYSQGQEANHSILCHHRQVKEFAMKCWQCGSLTRVTSTFTEESVKIRYRVCTGCGEKMRSFEEVERDHHVAQRLTHRVPPARSTALRFVLIAVPNPPKPARRNAVQVRADTTNALIAPRSFAMLARPQTPLALQCAARPKVTVSTVPNATISRGAVAKPKPLKSSNALHVNTGSKSRLMAMGNDSPKPNLSNNP